MDIISNYLMPGDASGLSEQERQDMAAFGLEAAKYLAENYLDESHAADFLSAMETVAKYGLNGSVSDGGKGRSFRHEKGQRLCRLEGKSGKDKAAGHIPECEIQRLPVIF